MYTTSALKNNRLVITASLLLIFLGLHCPVDAQSGKLIPISNHDTISPLFSVAANGLPIPTAKFKDVHYASFQQDGKVSIVIKYAEEIKDVSISPLSKNIHEKTIDKKTIEFSIAQPSYLVIKINKKERLFLFAEQVKKQQETTNTVNVLAYKPDLTGRELSTSTVQQAINETALNKQTLFFPQGIYKTGRLVIPSNAKLFFAPGALLKAADDITLLETPDHQRSKGFINLVNAENVSITGYGVIDGNGRLLRDKYGDAARLRLLFLSGCKNISINGITQRDPGSWNTQIMYSNNIVFKNVKLLNDVALSNTDGFDPDASSFVTIENCFAYCGDDNVAIKITQEAGAVNTTSDITVKGCVFLTRKSSLKVGTESRGGTIKNILFEDNDVIMSDRGMALYCSDGALYDNIRYINNRFEECYSDAKRMGIHFTINKRNPDSKAGIMNHVLIDRCTFYHAFPQRSEINGLDKEHAINVTIKSLVIDNNKCTTLEEAGIKTTFANVDIH